MAYFGSRNSKRPALNRPSLPTEEAEPLTHLARLPDGPGVVHVARVRTVPLGLVQVVVDADRSERNAEEVEESVDQLSPRVCCAGRRSRSGSPGCSGRARARCCAVGNREASSGNPWIRRTSRTGGSARGPGGRGCGAQSPRASGPPCRFPRSSPCRRRKSGSRPEAVRRRPFRSGNPIVSSMS